MDEPLTSGAHRTGPAPLVVAALAAFVESALGLGVVVPGEATVVVVTGAAAPRWPLAVLVAGVAVGACAGDHVGYLVGRRYGWRLRGTRLVRRLGVRHWDRAVGLTRRHGATAVVLSRLVPVVRTLTPAAAGAAGLPYRRFLPASAVGATAWASLWVGAGAGLASAAPALLEAPVALLGLLGGLVVGGLVTARHVRRVHA